MIKNGEIFEIDETGFGLSVIPVSLQKLPLLKEWKKYQSTIAPIKDWYSHFIKGGYVGIICGYISGHLEIIDIDVKNDPTGTIYNDFVRLIPPELHSRLIIQTTVNKGYHFIYRCNDITIEGNQKLAKHSDGAVIIETRGEGGYFCTSLVDYKVIQGKLDLQHLDDNIPIITAEEREFLLETARSLSRYCPPVKSSKNGDSFQYKEPAINEFNNKYHAVDLFVKHGWEIVKEDEDKYYLLRPGSTAPHSGYYFKDSKTFFCFSTSTPFATEKAYNTFQILQTLEGNGDYRTTLRLLPALGFPIHENTIRVSNDDIAEYLISIGVRNDLFIQDLTLNGKIVDETTYNTLYIDMKKHFGKEIPRAKFEETIKSHYIKPVNPVLDFVEKNKHRNPSGTFEKWLDCIELQNKNIDKTIAIYFLKKWYVGLIAQALGGQYPNEFFLALLSIEQGIGKTSLLRNYTLPKELQNYRVEHALSYDDDFKVIMSQSLLVIDDEMDGRTYETDKTFKTVLSIKELTTRRKYDRRISMLLRRCSFAGSGNSLSVIREQTNRRIIPIEIEKVYFDKLSEIDLTDLFMEAYHLYQNGFRYSYQAEEKTMLKHLYGDYLQKSDIDLILDDYIEAPENDNDRYFISTLDITTTLITHFPLFNKRIYGVTIGKLMNDRGFVTQRRGRNKTTGYEISRKSKILGILTPDILFGEKTP